eukprot:m.154608 g.154608  ORF g.154608 m.154608 type:complete len:58 (-) comp52893_c0_seq4:368-541(-)
MNYEVTSPWRPWTTTSSGDNPTTIKAGYVTQYGGANATEFYYLTVNGAGFVSSFLTT